MADIEEFVVVETPPELKRSDELRESSPLPEVTGEKEKTPSVTEEPADGDQPPEQEENQENKDEEPTPEETKEEKTEEEKTETQEEEKPSDTVEPAEPKEDEQPQPVEDDTKPNEESVETPATVEEDKPEDKSTEQDEEVATPDEDKKDDEKQPEETTATADQPLEPETKESEQSQETPAEQSASTEEQQPPATTEQEQPKQRAPVAVSGKQLKQLVTGTELLKAKKGTKVYPRLYYITGDLIRLAWNSKRKPVAKSQIALSQICDIISGRKSSSFQLYRGTQDEEMCFTIVYKESGVQKTIDLIASSPEEATLWTTGLLALTGSGVSENTAELRKKWLRGLFDEADINGDGTLDLKEIIKMLKRLNIGIAQKTLKKKFKAADSEGNGGNGDNKLDFNEFCSMFSDFSERPELRVLFNLYASSDSGSYMTADDLLNFMNTEQENENATIEYCMSVIERFEPSESAQQHLMSIDGFVQFISSDDNDIFNREHATIYQDMTRPLAHYFIASSHNTYLLEDQLSGPSSVDAYINALKKGCRCVELDCWDGEDNEPIVYHGHTLTSKILFKDCIEAIKEHAFTVSPYPVILSIENHCSVAQQHVLADHLKDILGDMLHNEERDEDLGKLPSPDDLKRKILVKAKKLPKEYEDKDDDDGEVSDEDEGAEVDEKEVAKVKESSKPVVDDPDNIPDGPEETQDDNNQSEVRKVVQDKSESVTSEDDEQKPSAKRKLSSKLSKCVNYVQSVHFKGFDEIHNIPFYHMSSFGESTAFKYSDIKAANYTEYNKKHLSRTYPAGVRVDSSNYEPIDLWNCGCQIVALNYQTTGKAMDYNIGKFQQNGGCGYILKPSWMLEDFSYFNHKDKDATCGITPKVVSIRVISAQHLPKPQGGDKDGEIIDPYVTVRIVGIPADNVSFKTKYIDDNGFNPVWNETFTKLITCPELAIVRFAVKDYDMLTRDDFIGQYTLPITSLNTGYRVVKLRNANWDVIDDASLLVEVRVHDWVGPTPKSKEKIRLLPIKKARQYPVIKPTSLPALEAIFRNAKQIVHTSTDIKEDYHYHLMLFKEACGKSSIPDCIEAMSSKARAARVQLKLTEISANKIYHVEVAGDGSHTGLPATLSKIMNTFNKLNSVIAVVLNTSQLTASELDELYTKALSHKEEFFKFVAQPGQAKKAATLKANYSNNVRILQNEANELKVAQENASKLLEKTSKFAEKFGITISIPAPVEEPTLNNEQEKPKDEQTTEPKEEPKDEEPKDEEPKTEESKAEDETEKPKTEESEEDEKGTGL